MRGRMDGAHVKAPPDVALYLLNYKRPMLQQIEERFGLPCYIENAPEMRAGHFSLERAAEGLIDWQPAKPVLSPESGFAAQSAEAEEEIDEAEHEAMLDAENEGEVIETGDEEREETSARGETRGDGEARRGRRRRRRGGRRGRGERGEQRFDREDEAHPSETAEGEPVAAEAGTQTGEDESAELAGEPRADNDDDRARRRRRGRRGGRRNRRRERDDQEQRFGESAEGEAAQDEQGSDFATAQDDQPTEEAPAEPITYEPHFAAEAEPEAPPVRHERIEIREISASESHEDEEPQAAAESGNGHDELRNGEDETDEDEAPGPVLSEAEPEAAEDPSRPRRKGWWQRKIFG